MLSAQAYTFEVNGIYYSFSGTARVSVTYGSGVKYSGSVDIPATVTYNGDTYRVISIGSEAFSNCSGLTSVTIPESVTSIGDWTFYCCPQLTSVTIGEGVTSIGNYAFSGCSGLTSVTIPEGVTFIGCGAFASKGLKSVEWNAVACQDLKADDYPFGYYSSRISSISFGNQVARIPAYLCYGLDSLTSVTIPERLDTIGQGAFYGCNNLLSVTSLAKRPPCCVNDEHSVFSVYDGTLYVPQGRKSAYESAFEWYKFSKIEEFSGISTVTVQSNDADMGVVTGGGQYRIGEQAVLAAIPNQGYHFVKWDDGVTANPRILTVTEDIVLTAIFSKDGGNPDDPDDPDNPDNPDNPDTPTANESPEVDNLRVYVQDRTIHLSEDRGAVQVYNMAGQCVYNGRATAIPVRQSGVYIVRVGGTKL